MNDYARTVANISESPTLPWTISYRTRDTDIRRNGFSARRPPPRSRVAEFLLTTIDDLDDRKLNRFIGA